MSLVTATCIRAARQNLRPLPVARLQRQATWRGTFSFEAAACLQLAFGRRSLSTLSSKSRSSSDSRSDSFQAAGLRRLSSSAPATPHGVQADVVGCVADRPDMFVSRAPERDCAVGGNDTLSFLRISLLDPRDNDYAELPSAAVVGWTWTSGGHPLGAVSPDNFVANGVFEDYLHSFLKEASSSSKHLQPLAAYQKDGWLHVGDERNPPPWGRIPMPEDIFGSVLLKNGAIVPGSYERNPTHRLVSRDGLFRLPDEFHVELASRLRALALGKKHHA